jgi:hypothetical protein
MVKHGIGALTSTMMARACMSLTNLRNIHYGKKIRRNFTKRGKRHLRIKEVHLRNLQIIPSNSTIA